MNQQSNQCTFLIRLAGHPCPFYRENTFILCSVNLPLLYGIIFVCHYPDLHRSHKADTSVADIMTVHMS